MYKPSTNKDQKNTKAWVQCGPSFFIYLFIYFQGCQPLLFKDLTLALQSNTRTEGGREKKKNTLLVKLIRLCKLFRFLKPFLVKSSMFHAQLVFSSSSSSPFPHSLMSLLEKTQRQTFGVGQAGASLFFSGRSFGQL